jgi:S1-C subfamily serine protease
MQGNRGLGAFEQERESDIDKQKWLSSLTERLKVSVLAALGWGGSGVVLLAGCSHSAPVAELPLSPTQNAEVDLSGQLDRGDRVLDDRSLADTYAFTASAGDRLLVEMSSQAFVPHLFAVGPDGQTLARQRGEPRQNKAVLNATLPRDGEYVVYFNAAAPAMRGPYGANLNLAQRQEEERDAGKAGDSSESNPDRTERGRLDVDDSGLVTNGSLMNAYQIEVTRRQLVTVDLDSEAFDTYLRLLDERGEVVAENDDRSDFNFNSRIEETLEPGTYSILVSSYGVLQQGEYTLGLTGLESLTELAMDAVPFTATSDLLPFNVREALAQLLKPIPNGDGEDALFRSVVQVYIGESSGSGTLLTSQGLVLTNFHVLTADEEAKEPLDEPVYVGIALQPDRPVTPLFQAKIERTDTDNDLALLRITGDLFGQPLPEALTFNTLPLGNPDGVILGEAVTVLGFPGTTAIQAGGASYLTLTQGVVSAILSRNGKRYDFISDVTVNAGNSGGATLNDKGELIAVPSGTVSETGSSPSDIDEASVLRAITAIPEEWLNLIRAD